MADDNALLDTLPPIQRLALSYAPIASRAALLALLALDTRLAGIVRSSREPMLAQLRLAWWREHLSAGAPAAPRGEPLLVALDAWPGDRAVLEALPSGWEALTGAPPLQPAAFELLAEVRAEAFAALVQEDRVRPAVLRMARNWALADIASRLSHPAEREAALALARAQDWRRESLPRPLRPLAVLHGLAKGDLNGENAARAISMSSFARAVRIGFFGR